MARVQFLTYYRRNVIKNGSKYKLLLFIVANKFSYLFLSNRFLEFFLLQIAETKKISAIIYLLTTNNCGLN